MDKGFTAYVGPDIHLDTIAVAMGQAHEEAAGYGSRGRCRQSTGSGRRGTGPIAR